MRRRRLAYLFPFVYGCAGALQLLLYSMDPHPEIAHLVTRATLFMKVPALGGLVYLLYATSQYVRAAPARSRTLTAVWVGTGVAVVALAAAFHEFVQRAGGLRRIWPGDEMDSGAAAVMDFPNYTATNVVAYELVAIVVIAILLPQLIRRVAQYEPAFVVVGLPLAVMFTLLIYMLVAPWSFVIDFDTFIGDSLLGGILAQLIYFAWPVDPLGAVGLAVAATTMWVMGEVWSTTSLAEQSVQTSVAMSRERESLAH